MSLIDRRKFQAYEKFYENVKKEIKEARNKITHNRSGKRSSSKSSESDEQMSDTELPKAELSVISDPPQNMIPVVKIWPLISEFLQKFEEVYTFKDKKIFGILNFLNMRKLRTALHKRELKAVSKFGKDQTLSLEEGQPEGLDPVKEKLSDAVFFLQKAKLTMKKDINKLGPEEYSEQLNTLSDLQVLISGFLTELKRESVKK